VDTDLHGKVAIITGGAGGIGAVFGRALAEAGASVVLADLDHQGALRTAGEVAADGLSVVGASLDVTDPISAAALAERAQSDFGGVDILVNCAALMAEIPFSPLATFPLDWWDRVMAVNVKGALVTTQAVVPSMTERGGGRIVNIASAGAFQAAGIYGISKYALVGLTLNLAAQLGANGITVNAIAPGLIQDPAGLRALPEGAMREAIKAGVPLKTHMEGPPEDLLGTLLLLVSGSGSWITGQTISVDGGWIMRF
jgi:NAD(P)-dependent dehydrogenase (short-subunit alcohol dehydrogenase family)